MHQSTKNGILIVGPIFNTPSGPSGPGGILYKRLKAEKKLVFRKSAFKGKLLRMLDTISFALFKSHKYDIILLQSFGLLAFVMEDLISKIAKILDKKIAFTLHGGAFLEFYQRYPKWVTRVLKRANIINTPSLYLQKTFEALGFQVEYMPNFIDLSKFQFKRDVTHKHSLLWVRGFHDIYNPELAIEIVEKLKLSYPNITLTMIGPDKGLLSTCKALIQSKGLQDNVIILGYISNDLLYKYYQTHQIFLTTTRYESFGVAIIEAASCGIPCVSTKVGEIPYLWQDGYDMILCERDAADFANKIGELFENVKLRNKISLNAKVTAEKFTWEKIRPLWIDTINRLKNK